jgi:HAD superfamily hydrolase (TIGR01509 family)
VVAIMSARAGILFDVDGTLVDTNYLHTLAWSRALAQAGEWAPMNAIHRLVGMGGDMLVEELIGHPSPEASDARSAIYKELIGEAKVFPGAQDLLRRVHESGLVVVLASSSPRDDLDVMIDLLDVGDVIDAVTCDDDLEQAKPTPEVFEVAMEAGGIDPELCLAIGDSIWDVQAARAAGIGCIGVETGGFSAHELREEGAVAVYRDAQEILAQYRTGPIGHLVAAMDA